MSKRKQEYAVYLRSEAWKAQRKRALMRAGHRCEVCSARHNLHVHHLTYQRLGAELQEDLRVLCENCHLAAHGYEIPKLVGKDKFLRRRGFRAKKKALRGATEPFAGEVNVYYRDPE